MSDHYSLHAFGCALFIYKMVKNIKKNKLKIMFDNEDREYIK